MTNFGGTPEENSAVQTAATAEQTPVDPSAVANSQPVDAVAASSGDTDAVAPTTTTPADASDVAVPVVVPTDGAVPDAGYVANSADVVGGPAVVTAEDVAELPASPVLFDGTATVAQRVEDNDVVAAVQADNASDTAAVAAAQGAEDAKFRLENPDSPVVRAANPLVGGEHF